MAAVMEEEVTAAIAEVVDINHLHAPAITQVEDSAREVIPEEADNVPATRDPPGVLVTIPVTTEVDNVPAIPATPVEVIAQIIPAVSAPAITVRNRDITPDINRDTIPADQCTRHPRLTVPIMNHHGRLHVHLTDGAPEEYIPPSQPYSA